MSYKVRFKQSRNVYDLIGLNGNKIIIRFNNGQSVGTVQKEGYELLSDKSWEEVEEELNNV